MSPVKELSPSGDCQLALRSLDRSSPAHLHEQVAAEIRRAIGNGEAKAGERIPKAKDLAAILGVNTNTVLRAVRVLRDEGLLELRRRRGITVAGTPDRSELVQHCRLAITTARRLGYSDIELHDLLQTLLKSAVGH